MLARGGEAVLLGGETAHAEGEEWGERSGEGHLALIVTWFASTNTSVLEASWQLPLFRSGNKVAKREKPSCKAGEEAKWAGERGETGLLSMRSLSPPAFFPLRFDFKSSCSWKLIRTEGIAVFRLSIMRPLQYCHRHS